MRKHIYFTASLFLVACSTTPKQADRATSNATASENQTPVMHNHGMAGMREPGSDPNGVTPLAYCKSLDANDGNTDNPTGDQINVIVQVMASREMRLHHALWHAVRGGATAAEVAQLDQVNDTGNSGPSLSWGSFHPYCPNPGVDTSNAYNPVGEDFLYMHRNMLNELRGAFRDAHVPCIKPWTKVPDPSKNIYSSTAWPMPDKDTAGVKGAAALQRLQNWDKNYFQNPQWLANHSLSQVGFALELTVHNNLHMRFASTKPPLGYKDAAPIGFDEQFPANWTYDSPHYHWLADPYGAAVDPVFWKIHGYVDMIIDKWMDANGKTSISSSCSPGDNTCYQWQGTWVGQVNLPDQQPAATQAMRAMAPGGSATSTDDLTARRMRAQFLGVLKDSDFAPKDGAVEDRAEAAPAPADPDPLEFAQGQFPNCNTGK